MVDSLASTSEVDGDDSKLEADTMGSDTEIEFQKPATTSTPTEESTEELETPTNSGKMEEEAAIVSDTQIQQPQTMAESDYLTELRGQMSKPKAKVLLEKVFGDEPLHFAECCKLVKQAGGNISSCGSGSSHFKVRLQNVLGYVLNSGSLENNVGAEIITGTVVRPHGKKHSPKVSKFNLRLFRSVFERAGITPKLLWPE